MPAQAGRSYYVSPHGHDGTRGAIDQPWKTLTYALTQLTPGDVLYVRGGTYFEHEIPLRLKGTAEAPITIQAYQGEEAVIDGGLPYFRDVPNSEWEVVDASIHLYRSTRRVDGESARAWLMKGNLQLVEYSSRANLESIHYDTVKGMQPFYMGPGVQLRDGYLYVRLQSNPNDNTDSTGRTLSELPSDLDPRHNGLAISTGRNLLVLDGAEHLVLQGLSFSHAETILDTKNGGHDIEISRCSFRYGTYGVLIRNGSHNWNIHESSFDNGLPEYVYWTDVKNGTREVAEAYPEFQSVAVDGWLTSVRVTQCIFRRSFDAIHVKSGTSGARIEGNVFEVIRDDGMEIETGASEVEVAHNMFWRVGSGVSHTGSAGSPGPVYVHHNVIDNSLLQHGGRPGNYREHDWPVWTTIDPFGGHDGSGKEASWRVYNNTIVTRRGGYRWNGAGPASVAGSREKFVCNNIFYVLDDRVVFRDDLASEGSHYDGDVIFRRERGRLPLFVRFGNGGNYPSLERFRVGSGTAWEARGLDVDPGFDVRMLQKPAVDGVAMWERYRPTNPSIFSSGASYEGVRWPGTDGVSYRGALPPRRGASIPETRAEMSRASRK